jgi:hypothetical protein
MPSVCASSAARNTRISFLVVGKDLDKFTKLFNEAKDDPSRGDFDDITEVCMTTASRACHPQSYSQNYVEASHQMVFYSTSQRVLQAEVDTILAALGGRPSMRKSRTRQ